MQSVEDLLNNGVEFIALRGPTVVDTEEEDYESERDSMKVSTLRTFEGNGVVVTNEQ